MRTPGDDVDQCVQDLYLKEPLQKLLILVR